MQNELFNDLESKIETMLDEVELLRMEISELRETKEKLEAEQLQTNAKVQQLLGKFSAVSELVTSE
ncbi:MAG: cell division protein ZapB [Amphritea sp.]